MGDQQQVEKRLKTIWDHKLKVTEATHGEAGLPRLVRLCRKLKLTEKESFVMAYVLSCQVGESRASSTRLMRYISTCKWSSMYGSDSKIT